MKKHIILALTIAASLQVYGQGTIVFQNASASAVTNGLTGQRVVAGTTFLVALYYVPYEAGVPVSNADFDTRGVMVGNPVGFASAGIYVGGTRTAPTAEPGAIGWFQVRAWESAFGSTYAEAVANPNPIGGRLALVGTSNIIQVDTGNPLTVPPGTAGTLTASGIQGFVLMPVPEPSLMALGVLGIGALLMLRRRN